MKWILLSIVSLLGVGGNLIVAASLAKKSEHAWFDLLQDPGFVFVVLVLTFFWTVWVIDVCASVGGIKLVGRNIQFKETRMYGADESTLLSNRTKIFFLYPFMVLFLTVLLAAQLSR